MNSKILSIKKTNFVRAGGRNFQFSVLSVIKSGDKYSFNKGKSKYLNKAIIKSAEFPKDFFFIKKKKILFTCKYKYCKTILCFYPSDKLIAGGIIKLLFNFLGIKKGICKNIGSSNIYNIVEIFKIHFGNVCKN
ncbi:hypothetical protein [Candidatus Vidania fulgoroideorum]